MGYIGSQEHFEDEVNAYYDEIERREEYQRQEEEREYNKFMCESEEAMKNE